jgi:hypothetical protein
MMAGHAAPCVAGNYEAGAGEKTSEASSGKSLMNCPAFVSSCIEEKS